MTERIFISHASEDGAVAEKIVAYLEAHGVACWISSRDIPPRAIYADAIVEGMQSCTACAVLVSAASNASKAVKREVELASHEDKAFIPIGIDGSEPISGLAYYLRSVQWLEYAKEKERALDKLIKALRLLETKSVSRPSIVGTWKSGTHSVTLYPDGRAITSDSLCGAYTCTRNSGWRVKDEVVEWGYVDPEVTWKEGYSGLIQGAEMLVNPRGIPMFWKELRLRKVD
ncbi:toll/interleukin-1 receptor domain-containing protein [Terricaulis sp.]|uniref:toll/interleukin-1 receptor domain-containing protein n=1 Tax=Terricaulis sp. TaxID=2768686 RepID=UPI0037833FC1